MIPSDADKKLSELIAKAFAALDVCEEEPGKIQAILDSAKGNPFSDEQVKRMLKKAKGELPVAERTEEEPEDLWYESSLTEEEEALVALHQNEGAELPAEIKEKLRRLREKARTEPEIEDEANE